MSHDPRYMLALGELLVFHKIIEKPEDLTEGNFKDIVIDLQRKANIYDDGVVGRETLWALQFPWVSQASKQMWVRCEADAVPGIEGSTQTVLREDTAARYQSLRRDVLSLGGVITSDEGRRELNAAVSSGRSAKSLHYTGVAFDLAVESGYFKPDTDPYVVTRGEDTYWVVWCRARGGEEMELGALHWRTWTSGVDLTKQVRGRFFNFTELCRRHGFSPIPPRAAFTRPHNRDYISAEWWHFQATELLIPNLSLFGIELLRIDGYTPAFIRSANDNIWGNRKALFVGNHFV